MTGTGMSGATSEGWQPWLPCLTVTADPTVVTGDQTEAVSQGCAHQADDDRAGAQQPCPVAMSASAKATKHPGGKRHRAIPAFRGEAGSEADTLGHLGLRPPFCQTAGAEI